MVVQWFTEYDPTSSFNGLASAVFYCCAPSEGNGIIQCAAADQGDDDQG